jgi:hypothetical protein
VAESRSTQRIDLPKHGVVTAVIAPQSDLWWLRVARVALPAIKSACVTWDGVMYCDSPKIIGNKQWLGHEWVHVLQQKRIGLPRFAAKYATARGRWELEREAFLYEIIYFGRSIDDCVEKLAGPLYKLDVTRSAMTAWFVSQMRVN